jgi:hypothetical protein
MVLAANLPWLLFPLLMLVRMRREHPFTEPVPHREPELVGQAP